MRHFLCAIILLVAGIGVKASDASILKTAQVREYINEQKLLDELHYSRERQQVREEKIYDRIALVHLRFEIQYGNSSPYPYTQRSRIGRVRGNERVR